VCAQGTPFDMTTLLQEGSSCDVSFCKCCREA